MEGPVSQNRVEVHGGAGHVIGEHNRIYNYFQAPQNRSIASKAIHFLALIERKTENFVGRQFVFDALDDFLSRNPSGYFVISGEPGIGKTALMAQLVKSRGYPHHFNVSQNNIRSPAQFLENACAQLVARYNLELENNQLPDDTARDSSTLLKLLGEAAKIPANRPVVLLVDALDEAEREALGIRANVLYLPWELPHGAYIVATTRPLDDLHLEAERRQDLFLEPDSAGNLADICSYIEDYLRREPGLRQRLADLGKSPAEFMQELTPASEGNFIYLRFVLPAITAGRFVHGRFIELPQGLQQYYKAHWRQMQATVGGEFAEVYAPVVCVLAVARQPESVERIARWTGLPGVKIQAALRQWHEFLEMDQSGGYTRYRVYHTSFKDFLDQQVRLEHYNELIADAYLKNLDLK
jgi:hypothetical protein